MAKIIFILGGARSGKSSYAVELAKKSRKRTAFIATCVLSDSEMRKRIKVHRKSRPRSWKVVEEGRDIGPCLANLKNEYGTILVDCLGLWISNLLAENLTDKKIEKEIKNLAKFIFRLKTNIVLVSNEAGSGIVPDNLLARRFRDLLGLTNQIMAKKADEVIFMQAGIPITIKRRNGNAEIK